MIRPTIRKITGRKPFNPEAIRKAADGACRRAFKKAGAFIMKTAKDSIRTRKKPAPPGQPPSSHTGTLKRFILFAYDPQRRVVIIGPKKLSKPGLATQALELSGRSKMAIRRKHKKKTVRIRVAARPYMRPALAKELDKIPTFFKDLMNPRGAKP